MRQQQQQNITLSREESEGTWARLPIPIKTSIVKGRPALPHSHSKQEERQEGGRLLSPSPLPRQDAGLLCTGCPAGGVEHGEDRIPSLVPTVTQDSCFGSLQVFMVQRQQLMKYNREI